MLQLNYRDPRPIYEQVKSEEHNINSGRRRLTYRIYDGSEA